jgi:hypothetical protein
VSSILPSLYLPYSPFYSSLVSFYLNAVKYSAHRLCFVDCVFYSFSCEAGMSFSDKFQELQHGTKLSGELTNISEEYLILKSCLAFVVNFKQVSLIRGNSTLVFTLETTKILRLKHVSRSNIKIRLI